MSGEDRMTPVERWQNKDDQTVNHNGLSCGLNHHSNCPSAECKQTNQSANQKTPNSKLLPSITNGEIDSSIRIQQDENRNYEQIELKPYACTCGAADKIMSNKVEPETTLSSQVDEDSEKKLSDNELKLNSTGSSTSSTLSSASHTEEDRKLAIELNGPPQKDKCSISAVRVVASLMLGVLFGFLLQKSSVYEPKSIRNQFLFEDFTMLKVFMAALGVGQLVLILLSVIPVSKTQLYFNTANQAYKSSIQNKGVVSTLLGSALLGIGMALSGGCPGMVLAQIGSAVPNGVFTILGALLGAFTYGLIADILLPLFKPKTTYKTYFIYELVKQKFFVLAIPSCVLAITAAVLFEYFFPLTQSSHMNQNATSTAPLIEENIFTIKKWLPSVCGAIIGLLQLGLVLSVQDTLGSSSGYQTVTSVWLCTDKLRRKFPYAAKYRTLTVDNMWQVVYLTGAIGGSAIAAAFSDSYMEPEGVNWYHGLVGGFIMLFGSRLASGCTSGHGLSGTSLLVTLSWLAVPAMFCGGIATAFIMKYSNTLTYTNTWLG